jgi:hypothetical protein
VFFVIVAVVVIAHVMVNCPKHAARLPRGTRLPPSVVRGQQVDRPNNVWSADITPMRLC